MTKYNVFQAIFMSFYSGNLYRDVARNWGGKAFFYLFTLLALSWIGQTITIQSTINHVYSQGSTLLVKQIPVVSVKEGVVSTPEQKPYIIKDPDDDGKIFAIIDTSGKYTELGENEGSLLITKTQVITRPDKNETRVYQLPQNLDMTFVPEAISEYLKNIVGYAWIPIFIALLCLSYIYRIIQVLLYSIIGKVFGYITGARVSYGKILQITMVAITPAIVLATVIDLFDYTFPHKNIAYFIISMFYMGYGILANKKDA